VKRCKAYPQIADWLQPVFASLDEKTLQKLNASIAVEGLDEESRRRLSATERAAEVGRA
jgi:glycine betaine/choline ABC-type transport system substrate-binding protein